MMDAAVPIVSRDRAWIANVATVLRSTDGSARNLPASGTRAVQPGIRLTGSLIGEVRGSWWVDTVTVNGERLERPIWFLNMTDWTLLPPDYGDNPALRGGAGGTTLTAARLTGQSWSFGPLDDKPYSNAYVFGPDGKIGGNSGPNHKLWDIVDGRLLMFTADRRLTFISEVAREEAGRLRLAGFRLLRPRSTLYGLLSENQPPATAPAKAAPGEDAVKLVIWDLDDTFWHGTLTEGGIKPIQQNIDIVRELSGRGIVNSVCSKNELERAKAELIALGVWDYFIFPRIAFAPKGALIKDIIETAQLRAPNVLFIDDNRMNLNEALHYNPGLQVCEPDAIAGLLQDRRLIGKPDPALARLANYKVLEKKALDQQAAGADNLEFLRQSDIRVSFHHDVLAEFPRIHDLVNRTNQLNFTKRRWPENIDEARGLYETELAEHFNSQAGYIKVADRYGNYGIVGFYFLRNNTCRHYLFSCRTLNMGIEQFVWQRLRRPYLKPVGEVVAAVGDDPDWITVVDDAEDAEAAEAVASRLKICVRGACDLRSTTHYLRQKHDTIEEFPYPYKGWSIYPVARSTAVYEETITPAGRALIEKIPGMPAGRFDSAIHTRDADVFILSFPMEVLSGLYRSKSTGMILPFSTEMMGFCEFSDMPYEKIADSAGGKTVSPADWAFMQNEFTFHGGLDLDMLAADVRTIFTKLRGKTVIILMLNETVGRNRWILQRWSSINAVIRPMVREFGYLSIEMNDFVRTKDDLTTPDDGGTHYNRAVYQKLADRLLKVIGETQAAGPVEVLEPA
jgi:FkbH-like protein